MVAVWLLQFPEEDLFTAFISLRQYQQMFSAVLHQTFLKKNQILLFLLEGIPPIYSTESLPKMVSGLNLLVCH